MLTDERIYTWKSHMQTKKINVSVLSRFIACTLALSQPVFADDTSESSDIKEDSTSWGGFVAALK